jgi:hypothetical protein
MTLTIDDPRADSADARATFRPKETSTGDMSRAGISFGVGLSVGTRVVWPGFMT